MDELELARCLLDYSTKGIKDLNSEPLITSSVVNRLLSQERFLQDPHGIARETAQLFNEAICEDLHALPMAIMSGLPQFYNLSEVQSNATRVCRTTHNHDRVVKSASLLASMVALILQVFYFYLLHRSIFVRVSKHSVKEQLKNDQKKILTPTNL